MFLIFLPLLYLLYICGLVTYAVHSYVLYVFQYMKNQFKYTRSYDIMKGLGKKL